MRGAWTIAIVTVAATMLSGVSPASGRSDGGKKESKAVRQLRAMTPEQFQSLATVKDDSLETVAVITTLNGFQEKRGLLGLVPFDVFLRAFVNKKTGITAYQVYVSSFYYAQDWAFWEMVNYATPSGPETAELDVLARDVGSCSAYLGCSYTETVAFDVPAAVLKAAAATYRPGEIEPWLFKLKAKSGVERTDGIAAAEVAGLLMAVDRYRADHNLPKPD